MTPEELAEIEEFSRKGFYDQDGNPRIGRDIRTLLDALEEKERKLSDLSEQIAEQRRR